MVAWFDFQNVKTKLGKILVMWGWTYIVSQPICCKIYGVDNKYFYAAYKANQFEVIEGQFSNWTWIEEA